MASLLLIDPCMCSIWIVGRMEIVDGFRLWKLCVYGVDEQELRLLVKNSRLLLFSPGRMASAVCLLRLLFRPASSPHLLLGCVRVL
jgi:hypothetical protein